MRPALPMFAVVLSIQVFRDLHVPSGLWRNEYVVSVSGDATGDERRVALSKNVEDLEWKSLICDYQVFICRNDMTRARRHQSVQRAKSHNKPAPPLRE